ncbi:hypothetical protein [Marimonas arenosa]|uniref:Uncharacterized protein n=1 Tax=Marimonas arenosa TaxID=1795305 RepID=A0AAE3WI89_9RHOB|nr:hypothetical protein [Marimonas arenosa]MDQ2092312.1 hypothetical protein [Marimonas arenosa]
MTDEEKREKFIRRLKDAPHGAKGFFETVANHFERRNDTSVKYSATNGGDMRLWAHWTSSRGADKKQIFATLAWQPENKAVFARCQLTPDELGLLGLEGGEKPKSEKEPQNSDIRLDEGFWRFCVEDFIRILEAARIKLVGA